MQKTNLNISPYYDDYQYENDFHRILFRPGFAIQARELTQLQSILQNQIEKFGRHFFKEGSVVVPGQTGYTNELFAVKVEDTFNLSDITPTVENLIGKDIVGEHGATARVITYTPVTTEGDPFTIYVKYIAAANDNETTRFIENEELMYEDNQDEDNVQLVVFAKLIAENATDIGASASVEEGVYFVRGHFIRVAQQRIILSKYNNSPNARVGLEIQENLVTPEESSDLLDNAQGTTNYNAKGAHRLQITLTLVAKDLGSTDDANFVELMRIKEGRLQHNARSNEYSVLQENLAKRTYDQLGNFTVKSFKVNLRETLNDGENNGVYGSEISETDDGNTPSDDLVTLEISPGHAYVDGYDLQTIAPTYIDSDKPRTFNTVSQSNTVMEVGNYVIVNNAYSIPTISQGSDEGYNIVELYDNFYTLSGDPETPTIASTYNTSNRNPIGFARTRAFETSAIIGDIDEHKLYLYDLKMFTKITFDGSIASGDIPPIGDKVAGQVSGAWGYVEITDTSDGDHILYLTNVVGNFSETEKIKSTFHKKNIDISLKSVKSFNFDQVKSIKSPDGVTNSDKFSCNTITLIKNNTDTNKFTITGNVDVATVNENEIIGYSTKFETELLPGDLLEVPTNEGPVFVLVKDITNNNKILYDVILGQTTTIPTPTEGGINSATLTRHRTNLKDQNKNLMIRKVNKDMVKTLSSIDSQGAPIYPEISARRVFEGSVSSGGNAFSIQAPFGIFDGLGEEDLIISNINTGDVYHKGTSWGDTETKIVTAVPDDTGKQLSIGQLPVATEQTNYKVIATLRYQRKEKLKTISKCNLLIVKEQDSNVKYGTSTEHIDLSLGVPDILKVHAVLQSNSGYPKIPEYSVTTKTDFTSIFNIGETIRGIESNAVAIVVEPILSDKIKYILKSENKFNPGEDIIGVSSGARVTLNQEIHEGSYNIVNDFLLDTGQRDNFYDIGRLTRKASAPVPSGNLLIIYDYFIHDSGDFFTVDSYNSIDYKDIPTYSATRIDPEVREPTGEYSLRDSIDYRQTISDIPKRAVNVDEGNQKYDAYEIIDSSFNFSSRKIAGNNSLPKDNSFATYDMEYYLGRIDALYITSAGEFKISYGIPSEQPEPPQKLENAMELGVMNMPAYLSELKSARFTHTVNKRYTMKDIGAIEKRLSSIEYYTSLNLLEKSTEAMQVKDINGLDRFKSGFIVDNFKGHGTGDVAHPDYNVSMDMESGMLRPKFCMKNIGLVEKNTDNTKRLSNGYQKTGAVYTLPYSNVISSQQSYATRVENVNPVLSFTWSGVCKLDPSGDEWFETKRLPALIKNVEGNFDSFLAENKNAIGTVWNSWETTWSGTVQWGSETHDSRSSRRWGLWREITDTYVTRGKESGTSVRTGTKTEVVPQIDYESQGDKIVSQALIPFMRSKNITFEAKGLKPKTKLYAFFDKTSVTSYCTQYEEGGDSLSSESGILVTDGIGDIKGLFKLPDPNVRGNPQFKTGDRLFRLTSNKDNSEISVETFAQEIYSATGILNSIQETIHAVRNGRIQTTNVSQKVTTERDRSKSRTHVWIDPIAQSIMVETNGGEYITKCDVFFQQKDNTIPITMQIREMSNGYPTLKVLPFGSVTLRPDEVTVDNTSQTPTSFVFDSPVYLKEGVEYCIVLITDSDKYLVWISRMGENDVVSNRNISKQPTLGVFFKSQNNSTWVASQLEDLKFTLYRAEFDTSKIGQIEFVNEDIPYERLNTNPIQTFKDDNKIKVYFDNHQMHSKDNRVYISGVEGNRKNSVIDISTSGDLSVFTGGAGPIRTSDASVIVSTSSNGKELELEISNDKIKILNPGFNYLNGELLTLSYSGRSLDCTIDAVDDTIGGIPISLINKTHDNIHMSQLDYFILNINLDSYPINTAMENLKFGGTNVMCSHNIQFELSKSMLPFISHTDTSVDCMIKTTSATSVSGEENSFTIENNYQNILLNENYIYDTTRMVASKENETIRLAGRKSLSFLVEMKSKKSNLSPVIDSDRKSIVCVNNRINYIDPSDPNVYPVESYISPTEATGDQCEMIYMTRKIQLENPASSLKLFIEYNRSSQDSQIQLMYKILRSDDTTDFEDIGWTYFNENGLPDVITAPIDDFIEYEYTADDLDEFISFAIKIRSMGKNAASDISVFRNLRVLALAT